MIEAAAKRFASSLRSRIRPLPSSTRALDNAIERGYERPLLGDRTMARTFPFLAGMTLETIHLLLAALGQALA
jgi:hypothetical protein